jgi:hypothetical protein
VGAGTQVQTIRIPGVVGMDATASPTEASRLGRDVSIASECGKRWRVSGRETALASLA